jgi:4-amino-4-deoxy-L-arabinose transferase-like glycosyltransferase
MIGAGTLRRGHEWGDDFASYILQAKSIADGTTSEFVEHNAITIFHSSIRIGPVAYPWGYPLLLTPAYLLKGINPLALKLPGLIFYMGFLVVLYRMLIERLTQTESLLLVGLFAFNPLLLQFLDQILSDIPFLFFSTLSVYLVTKEERTLIHFILLGVSLFFTVFIRTTGIVLLLIFLVLELYFMITKVPNQNTRRQIILNMLITCVIFTVLWLLNILFFPGGSESYLAQYAGLSWETVTSLLSGYFNVFSLFFGESTAWNVLYYVLVAFFLLGAWQKHREEPVFILFFTLWLLVHITWPYWQGPRFIFPLLPIFIYFSFQGMKFLLGKLPEHFRENGQWIVYSFWLILGCTFLFTSGVNAYENLQNDRSINGPFDPYSKEVYNYIKDETSADSVVVFFKPRVMRLMTDRDAIMSMECDRILRGDYLVLSRKVGRNQQIPPEEISACNLPLQEVFKNTRFIIYQIRN